MVDNWVGVQTSRPLMPPSCSPCPSSQLPKHSPTWKKWSTFSFYVSCWNVQAWGSPWSAGEASRVLTSYFSKSEWNVMLSSLELKVEVTENDGCLTIFCSFDRMGSRGWESALNHERQHLGFELLNGKHNGGGGGARGGGGMMVDKQVVEKYSWWD